MYLYYVYYIYTSQVVKKEQKKLDADIPFTPPGVNTKCTTEVTDDLPYGCVYGPQSQQIPVTIFTLTHNADHSIKTNYIPVPLKNTRIQ